MQFPGLIVQKFGGATLADPSKIKHAAERVAALAKSHPIIVVVSAMGNTTNSLIELAQKVSHRPHRRELDMLLTAGERMSMSLMSMALNDLGCAAISFTGSQAGIMTDDSHANAFIQEVKPVRVVEALLDCKVAILAGFQGVSPKTKEITTLGRGGSDTTAVAMAAHFKAERCDILKEVPSVFTADPRKVTTSRSLHCLTYKELTEMSFWGAKVLHYKSAELAMQNKVPLYIGPAADSEVDLKKGTLVSEKAESRENWEHLSVNSHDCVLIVEFPNVDKNGAAEALKKFLESHDIPPCQTLHFEEDNKKIRIWLTGPAEVTLTLRSEFEKSGLRLDNKDFASVTMTCSSPATEKKLKKLFAHLGEARVPVHAGTFGGNSLTVLVSANQQVMALKSLHQLIEDQPPGR
jgi:aspartate kinase